MPEMMQPRMSSGFMATMKSFLPYNAIAAMSALASIFAILAGRHFRVTFATFLYAVAGVLWRHFTNEIRSAFRIPESSGADQVITLLYHAGNAVLFVLLVRLLADFAEGIVEVGI